MNSNGRFWEIGLKVIAAAVVGIAVFVGIDRSTSKRSTNFNGQGNNNQEPEPKNNTWSQPGEQQQQSQNNDNQAPQNYAEHVVSMILRKIHHIAYIAQWTICEENIPSENVALRVNDIKEISPRVIQINTLKFICNVWNIHCEQSHNR